jgi:hypothetical protein
LNFAELPATITGVILLILKELLKEKERSGMSVDELVESALKQTTANEDRIKELLEAVKQDMQ